GTVGPSQRGATLAAIRLENESTRPGSSEPCSDSCASATEGSASTAATIKERSGAAGGRHLPSRSGATHVPKERSGVTVGRQLLPFAGVGMPSRSGAIHVTDSLILRVARF